jgi:hypothetical protein
VFKRFEFQENSFSNVEENNFNKNSVLGFGKIQLLYDDKKNHMFDYEIKYNQVRDNIDNNLVFNETTQNELLVDHQKALNQRLNYTYKISENDILLVTTRYSVNEQPQNYNVNNVLFDEILGETSQIESARQSSILNVSFFGIESNFLKKHNNSLLEIILGNTIETSKFYSKLSLITDSNLELIPDGFQNMFVYKQSNLYLKIKYLKEWRKFTLKTKVEANQMNNILRQQNTEVNENPLVFNPDAELIWDFRDNKSFSMYMSNYYTNLSTLDVIPNQYLSSFNGFSRGTNAVSQLGTTNVRLNYRYENWKKSYFLNAFLFYSKNHEWLSTNSVLTQNYAIVNKALVNNTDSFSGSLVFDKFFKSISSNLKISLGYSESNFKNIVNQSELRPISAKIYRAGFELRSGFKGIFNYHFGSSLTNNSVESTNKNSFTNNFTFFDLSFVFNDNYLFLLQSEQYYFGNQTSTNKYYRFLDSEFRFNVVINKFLIALLGYNILNTNIFSNLWVSDVNTVETQYRILPSRLMVKATYSF